VKPTDINKAAKDKKTLVGIPAQRMAGKPVIKSAAKAAANTAAGGLTAAPTPLLQRALDHWSPADALAFIDAAADVALVLDGAGVVREVRLGHDGPPREACLGWTGKPWIDIVTRESRDKVSALIADARAGAPARWRHVNHPLAQGDNLAVMYAVSRLGSDGPLVAIGRDMRSLAGLQQRLVDAQHALERDYWRLRSVETRFRLLFDMAAEAIVVVDAGNARIVEANPAALEFFGLPERRLLGQTFPFGLPDKAQRELQALMGRVQSTGRGDELKLRGGPGKGELQVDVRLLRHDDEQLLLVRLRTAAVGSPAGDGPRAQALVQAAERMPDGLLVTDTDGRVLSANAAFINLVQLASEEPLRGESLARWLGRPGVDLNVMLATLRQQGSVRLFATALRSEQGAEVEVEISAVSLPELDPPALAFLVRHVGRRLSVASHSVKTAPRSVEQLAQLVGRMPLKDLVRESSDLIERLCIEAALQLTQNNRASAAEMLGLSRQSLYVKLRRFGMIDSGGNGAEDDS
jgi:transcriptional regulator PpsR